MCLEGAAELLFGHAQCFVRRPPGGDIAHECAEQPRRPDSHRGYGELHGELGTVAPQRGELDALVENWSLASGEEAAQPGRMSLAMGVRYDDVGEALPEDLPLGPSEHGLGLLVPGRDAPSVIHGDVGVERRAQDSCEASFRRPQRLLGSRALNCRLDLGRNELEHLLVVLLVANAPGVGLHGKHTDGAVSLFEGHAQPVD